jgi:hypothetical protein
MERDHKISTFAFITKTFEYYFHTDDNVTSWRPSIRMLSFNSLLGEFAEMRKGTINLVISVLCMSVCPSVRQSAWNNSAPTARIFIKFNITVFFENLSRKFKFY